MTQNKKNTEIYVAYDDHEPFDPSRPERNLLRAVLSSAMSDMQKGGTSAEKAQEYFLSPEDDYLFSFRSVCNFLELDPKTILIVVGLEDRLPLAKPQRAANPEASTDLQ
ncbi:MAG: hypothetical protein K1X83_06100 [Oligoflexia bacterium]|nr:hypothetical protein [Oligoflexia bacterium]